MTTTKLAEIGGKGAFQLKQKEYRKSGNTLERANSKLEKLSLERVLQQQKCN